MKKFAIMLMALILVVSMATVAFAAGTGAQADPYVIDSLYALTGIDAAPGDTYYQFDASLAGMVLQIMGDENLTFTLAGTPLTPVDGDYEATLVASGTDPIVLKVTNSTAAEIETGAGLMPPQGSMDNPYVIENIYDLYGIDAAPGDTYYVFRAGLAGKVLSIDAAEGLTFQLNGTTLVAEDNVYTATLEPAGPRGAMLLVTNSTAAEIETAAGLMDPLGSEGNPYAINGADELNGIEVPAEGEVNYRISAMLAGKVLVITADDALTVNVNGTDATAVDGVYTIDLVPMGPGGVFVKFSNSSDTEVETEAYITDPLGSENNPYVIGNAYDLTGIDAVPGETYYAISSMLAGKLLVLEADENLTYTLNGEDVEAGAHELVPMGPSIRLVVTNASDEEVEVGAAITDPLGSETNPYVINNAADMTGIDAAPGETYYAISSMLAGKLLVLPADKDLTYTLNGKKVEAGEYELVPAGPVISLVITNASDDEIEVPAAIIEPKGSESNPIQVETGDSKVTVGAGEEVHYIANSKMDGMTLVVKGEGAYVIVNGKKYEAKNGVVSVVLKADGPTISVVIGNAGTKAADLAVTVAFDDNADTGDVSAIFTAIAAAVMSMTGTVALVAKKKEN